MHTLKSLLLSEGLQKESVNKAAFLYFTMYRSAAELKEIKKCAQNIKDKIVKLKHHHI